VLAVFYFGVRYYTLSKRLAELNKEVATLVGQAIPDVNQKKIAAASAALSTVKARRTEVTDRLTKLSAALSSSGMDILKDVSSAFPPKEEVQVDIDDLNYSQGRLKLSGRTTSFEAVDKIKAAMDKSGKFKDVATGNVRKGTKEDIKFDMTAELAGK
jgi:Tfp pilus assembly protein PilN